MRQGFPTTKTACQANTDNERRGVEPTKKVATMRQRQYTVIWKNGCSVRLEQEWGQCEIDARVRAM